MKPTQELMQIVDPVKYIRHLLDQLKISQISATVRGMLWHLIGVLFGKYYEAFEDGLKLEMQTVALA